MRATAREYIDITSLITRQLEHQVRRGAEAIETEAMSFLRAAEAEGAVSDDAGAEQRSRVFVGEYGGQWVGEVFTNHAEFGVASVDVVAGELGMLAEILGVAPAVGASAVGGGGPGDADSVTSFQSADVGADRVDCADDLVAGDQREFGEREVALHGVEIGVAESAAVDADADFVGAGKGLI